MGRASADSDRLRVAWSLLDFSREYLATLEEGATRVVAAQVAGLIALWAALHDFDPGAPRGLAWGAWAALLLSISWLGRLVTPRRLAHFWGRLPLRDVLATNEELTERSEAQLLRSLAEAVREQTDRLHAGLRASIALGISALALAAIGYIIDQS
jgi:hypothetical protein